MRHTLLIPIAIGTVLCFNFSFGQNIGINTDGTAGQTLLHTKNTTAGEHNYLRIENTQGGMQSALQLLNSGTANADWIQYIPGGTTDLRFYRGADKVTFLSSGYVGFGTNSPQAPHHLYSASGSDVWTTFGTNSSTNTDGLNLGYSGATFGAGTSFLNAHSATAANGKLYFLVNWNTRMTINNSGHVGIGVTTPSRAFVEQSGLIGNTAAMFGSGSTGISLIANWPTLYFNGYWSGGPKSMASGYGGNFCLNPSTGAFIWRTTDNPAAADATFTETQRMTLLNNGNAGIGVASPLATLHLSASTGLRLDSPADDTFPAITTGTRSTGGEIRAEAGQNSDYGTLILSAGGETGLSQKMSLVLKGYGLTDNVQARFIAGNTPIMTIRNSGYVGIGTTNPSRYLDVQGSGAGLHTACFLNNTGYGLALGATTGITYGSIQAYSSGTGTAVPLVFQGALGGTVGIGTTNPASPSIFQVIGVSWFANNSGYTAGDAVGIGNDVWLADYDVANSVSINGMQNSTVGSIRLGSGGGTISGSGGNIGIGTTTPGVTLDVNGNTRTCGLYYTSYLGGCSDLRYKKDIQPLTGSLNNVVKLQGVNYYWKVDEFPDRHFTKEKQIGFIAQEIEKIYPEVVLTDKDGYKSVDYSRLTPILAEAIKEQQKLIEALSSENKKLAAVNDVLKKETDALKAEFASYKEIIKTLQLQSNSSVKK